MEQHGAGLPIRGPPPYPPHLKVAGQEGDAGARIAENLDGLQQRHVTEAAHGDRRGGDEEWGGWTRRQSRRGRNTTLVPRFDTAFQTVRITNTQTNGCPPHLRALRQCCEATSCRARWTMALCTAWMAAAPPPSPIPPLNPPNVRPPLPKMLSPPPSPPPSS